MFPQKLKARSFSICFKQSPATRSLRAMALALIALVPLFGAGTLNAQDIFGRISGTVTDSSGAAIPGAKVTVVNQATKATRIATTDSKGFYVASELPVGTYEVAAEQTGFKTTTQAGNNLTAGGRITVDLHLQ